MGVNCHSGMALFMEFDLLLTNSRGAKTPKRTCGQICCFKVKSSYIPSEGQVQLGCTWTSEVQRDHVLTQDCTDSTECLVVQANVYVTPSEPKLSLHSGFKVESPLHLPMGSMWPLPQPVWLSFVRRTHTVLKHHQAWVLRTQPYVEPPLSWVGRSTGGINGARFEGSRYRAARSADLKRANMSGINQQNVVFSLLPKWTVNLVCTCVCICVCVCMCLCLYVRVYHNLSSQKCVQ